MYRWQMCILLPKLYSSDLGEDYHQILRPPIKLDSLKPGVLFYCYNKIPGFLDSRLCFTFKGENVKSSLVKIFSQRWAVFQYTWIKILEMKLNSRRFLLLIHNKMTLIHQFLSCQLVIHEINIDGGSFSPFEGNTNLYLSSHPFLGKVLTCSPGCFQTCTL